METKFNHIEYCLIDSKLYIWLSCNEDEKLQAEICVDKRRLLELFSDEFITYRLKKRDRCPPDWVPDGGEITLEFWYENYMNKSKAWQIFEAVSIDELTFNTTS